MRRIILFLAVAVLAVTCKQYTEMSTSQPTSKQLKPKEATAFHEPLSIRIAWVPYEENQIVAFEGNQYVFEYNDGLKSGRALPMIVIDHQNSSDSILIEMDIDNELLGRLIKRSIMTQKPIERPFTKYFEEAKCQSCHPSEIKVNLD